MGGWQVREPAIRGFSGALVHSAINRSSRGGQGVRYGKDGELTGADRDDQETSMLALHLLQSALVHLNTLLVQRVLADPAWASRLTDDDRRGLTPLFWSNINPYGTFHLDMTTRIDLERTPQAAATS